MNSCADNLGCRKVRRIPLKKILFVLLLALSVPRLVAAAVEPIPDDAEYPVPADLSGVHFYLITVDVGNSVWDNFGHTALRVFDENTGSDTIYNWGGFDASQGVVNFSWNFFKGIMNYTMFQSSPAAEFANYSSQQRSVWQDRINLTNPQKEKLYRRLMWNSEPGNRVYAYHYFDDNCTTRVRDYLDEALGGRIANAYQQVTDTTYRDLVRSHYASLSVIGMSLDILMNNNIDRPVSEWGSMFLPINLRTRLAGIDSDVAENGKRLKLLSEPELVREFPPPLQQQDAYQASAVILLAPVLFLFMLLKKIPMSYFATHSRIGLKWSGFSFRLLGLLGILTAGVSGLYGCLMLGSWFVSDHLDLHHNLNLLLFWPTDLLGMVVGFRWLLMSKPWPMTHNSAPFINYYLFAHLVAMLVFAVVAFAGLSPQTIREVAIYIVPGFFLYTVLVWLVGFQPARPRNMFF